MSVLVLAVAEGKRVSMTKAGVSLETISEPSARAAGEPASSTKLSRNWCQRLIENLDGFLESGFGGRGRCLPRALVANGLIHVAVHGVRSAGVLAGVVGGGQRKGDSPTGMSGLQALALFLPVWSLEGRLAWPAPLRSPCSRLLLNWGKDNPKAVVVPPAGRAVGVAEGRRAVAGVVAPTAAA